MLKIEFQVSLSHPTSKEQQRKPFLVTSEKWKNDKVEKCNPFLLQIPATAPIFHIAPTLQSRDLICDLHICVVLLQLQAYIHSYNYASS